VQNFFRLAQAPLFLSAFVLLLFPLRAVLLLPQSQGKRVKPMGD
jgi:hypothetical protein